MSKHVTKYGMHYRCGECGYETVMWLEKGLEEPGKDHKPVPFAILCPKCDRAQGEGQGATSDGQHGFMQHVDWRQDVCLPGYRPIAPYMDFFRNSRKSDCGVPVFAKEVAE